MQVVLPSLAAAALVLAVFLIGGRKWGAVVGPALAVVAGVAAGNYQREAPLPWLPDQEVWHWLPAAILAALGAGLLAQVPRVPAVIGWLLRAAAAGLATWLLVPEELRTEAWWVVPAFFAAVLADWAALELAARRAPGGAVPAGLALVCAGAAAVLVHHYSARFADIALMQAGALAGIALVAGLARADCATAMPAGAVLLPGLLLAGYHGMESEIPWVSFALTTLAPLALVPTLLPPLSRLRPVLLRTVQLALLLAPVVVAVALAMKAEPMEFDEGPGDDSGEAESSASSWRIKR
jgi:hypothetical protein